MSDVPNVWIQLSPGQFNQLFMSIPEEARVNITRSLVESFASRHIRGIMTKEMENRIETLSIGLWREVLQEKTDGFLAPGGNPGSSRSIPQAFKDRLVREFDFDLDALLDDSTRDLKESARFRMTDTLTQCQQETERRMTEYLAGLDRHLEDLVRQQIQNIFSGLVSKTGS